MRQKQMKEMGFALDYKIQILDSRKYNYIQLDRVVMNCGYIIRALDTGNDICFYPYDKTNHKRQKAENTNGITMSGVKEN